MKNINCRVNKDCQLEVMNSSLSRVEKSIIEEVINSHFDNCSSEYKDKFFVNFLGRTFDVYRFEVSLKDFVDMKDMFDYESEQEALMTEKMWKETIDMIDRELMSA